MYEESVFLIETIVPIPGEGETMWDEAEATTPGGAFNAVETLLREMGIDTGFARVTNLETGIVVWQGDSVATRI